MGKCIKRGDILFGFDVSQGGDFTTAVAMKMRADGTIELIDAKDFYRQPDDVVEGEAVDITDQKSIAMSKSHKT